MENKKVKVKLVVGYRKYQVIEVDESEVEKIREVNRMTWRELDKEKHRKANFEKNGMTLTSLEAMQEECEVIADTNYTDPLEEIIEEEDKKERYGRLYEAMKSLNERQKVFVKLIYFEGKSQDEVAELFGITKAAVSNAMQRIYATLKKILEKF